MKAFSSILLAALALAGCASPYSYSQLDGYRYHRAEINTYPLIIAAVDGQSTPTRSPVLVEPGMRKVVVQGPPTATSRFGDEQTLTLDVKPCTHYYLVAVKENRLSRDFTVRIDYEEPVAGCSAPAAK